MTGDVLGSLRCDCREQLEAALETAVVKSNGTYGKHALEKCQAIIDAARAERSDAGHAVRVAARHRRSSQHSAGARGAAATRRRSRLNRSVGRVP